MPISERRMHLNAFLMGSGHHEAAWRLPWSRPESITDLAHFQNLARIAERGTLDSVFFADTLALQPKARHNVHNSLDPLLVLATMATVTEHVGLIATASTGFHEPFDLARRFASLDHLSHGRAGWNVVTSSTDVEARNFGRAQHDAHADRYVRAAEFLDVATRLWDSWDDDALVADKDAGIFADTDRIHRLDHDGQYFRVDGPGQVPRSPQGRPLIVQAGSSAAGQDLAARYAEAVFTAHQDLAGAQAFYRELKALTASHGRDADQVKILPGIVPVLGRTEAEARELEHAFDEALVVEYGLGQVSGMLGLDLSEHPLDERLPELPPIEQFNGNKSRFALVARLAEVEKLTLRQILRRLGGGRGHRVVTGDPEQIADEMQTWFHAGAADGFNVMAPHLPRGLEDFVEYVVPELRRRGLFRSEYEGATLREHYGLERPVSRFADTRVLAGASA